MSDEPVIPVRNLFHLLCYAWNHPLASAGNKDFEADRHSDLNQLFARILGLGVSELLQAGLDRSYVRCEETTPKIRGRIDFTESIRTLTWHRGRLHCLHDEFELDIEANRLIKSTLLLFAADRGNDSRNLILECLHGFSGIDPAKDTRPAAFRRIQIHRNNRRYRFVLSICELIHASLLPDRSSSGVRHFSDFTRDEKVMAGIFEKFVFNFAKRHLSDEYKISAMMLEWQACGSEDALSLLPIMKTDVTLQSSDHRVILDCKYYADALATRSNHGVEWKRVRSGHLYQLYAYLTNAAARFPEWQNGEGILLYPTAKSSLDLAVTLFESHRLRIVTLDLSAVWWEIEQRLESILRTSEGP